MVLAPKPSSPCSRASCSFASVPSSSLTSVPCSFRFRCRNPCGRSATPRNDRSTSRVHHQSRTAGASRIACRIRKRGDESRRMPAVGFGRFLRCEAMTSRTLAVVRERGSDRRSERCCTHKIHCQRKVRNEMTSIPADVTGSPPTSLILFAGNHTRCEVKTTSCEPITPKLLYRLSILTAKSALDGYEEAGGKTDHL